MGNRDVGPIAELFYKISNVCSYSVFCAKTYIDIIIFVPKDLERLQRKKNMNLKCINGTMLTLACETK